MSNNRIIINGVTLEVPPGMQIEISGTTVRLNRCSENEVAASQDKPELVPDAPTVPSTINRTANRQKVGRPRKYPEISNYEQKTQKILVYLRSRGGLAYRRGIYTAVYGRAEKLDERGKSITYAQDKIELKAILCTMRENGLIREYSNPKGARALWALPHIDASTVEAVKARGDQEA
mgnify:CR=1 FL=1